MTHDIQQIRERVHARMRQEYEAWGPLKQLLPRDGTCISERIDRFVDWLEAVLEEPFSQQQEDAEVEYESIIARVQALPKWHTCCVELNMDSGQVGKLVDFVLDRQGTDEEYGFARKLFETAGVFLY